MGELGVNPFVPEEQPLAPQTSEVPPFKSEMVLYGDSVQQYLNGIKHNQQNLTQEEESELIKTACVGAVAKMVRRLRDPETSEATLENAHSVIASDPKKGSKKLKRTAAQKEAEAARLETIASDPHVPLGRLCLVATDEELDTLATEGDAAMLYLLLRNLRLPAALQKRYAHLENEEADRIQNGNLGMIEAALRFDFRRSTRFSTYATPWIGQKIMRNYDETERPVVTSVHAVEAWRKISACQKAFYQEQGREITTNELAAQTGYSKDFLAEVIRANRRRVSLDEAIAEDTTETRGDRIIDETLHFDEVVTDRIIRAEFEATLAEVLASTLTEREMQILSFRYDLDHTGEKPKTYQEIGKLYGIAHNTVMQIERRALRKLKTNGEQQLGPFLYLLAS